ncbi:dehydrogenase [Streptomyces sp. NPDC049597]|uniref:dehydrogenase n=1 Tax=Streptomyces sp. NPDC049597 TaxID=3155276 RepID=UPI0034364F31
MVHSSPTPCPECAQPMRFGGWALCRREEDGARVCRGLWECPQRHFWWQWADRKDTAPEPCSYPHLFGR